MRKKNPSNRFESHLIETSKKIIRFLSFHSLTRSNPPLSQSIVIGTTRIYSFTHASYEIDQTHDLFAPRNKQRYSKKKKKQHKNRSREAREKKRKFREWLRAEKAGNKFLNAQVATTFCYCSFYFLPSLHRCRENHLKMCATRSHQYTSAIGGKKKKKVLLYVRKPLKECWAAFASQGKKRTMLNNELRNGQLFARF